MKACKTILWKSLPAACLVISVLMAGDVMSADRSTEGQEAHPGITERSPVGESLRELTREIQEQTIIQLLEANPSAKSCEVPGAGTSSTLITVRGCNEDSYLEACKQAEREARERCKNVCAKFNKLDDSSDPTGQSCRRSSVNVPVLTSFSTAPNPCDKDRENAQCKINVTCICDP